MGYLALLHVDHALQGRISQEVQQHEGEAVRTVVTQGTKGICITAYNVVRMCSYITPSRGRLTRFKKLFYWHDDRVFDQFYDVLLFHKAHFSSMRVKR